MSALALLLKRRGYAVRGSDQRESERVKMLRKRGIPVHIGEEEAIFEQTVVYTGAVPSTQKQFQAAKGAGKRLLSRARLLGMIAEEYPHVIAVVGCHGKTTTTAMLAHIFAAARLPFTCHIGGEDTTFKNLAYFGKKYLVTEACEYQKSFLELKCECAVLLNVDRDHMDCYEDEEELLSAFSKFASGAKTVVGNGDDFKTRALAHTCTFGLDFGDIRAENLSAQGERYSFTVTEKGKYLTEITLQIPGRVHVYNALAAISAARRYNISAEHIKKGLFSFQGVKRRFEQKGTIAHIPTYIDYAHHPREILESMKTAQAICKGTVHVVFQPHTYSRTRDLMPEFVNVLKKAENPIIYQTYAAREEYDFEGSAVALTSKIPEAVYAQTPEQVKMRLNGAFKKGDIILFLGAGDIDQVCKSLLD